MKQVAYLNLIFFILFFFILIISLSGCAVDVKVDDQTFKHEVIHRLAFEAPTTMFQDECTIKYSEVENEEERNNLIESCIIEKINDYNRIIDYIITTINQNQEGK